MLPITRATINNLCRACLQDLDKAKSTQLQHNLKEDLKLLRIVELLADGIQPITTRVNLTMPTRVCQNCYTKIGIFCKFAEMSICSKIALNEITAEHPDITENTKFKLICATCFKVKSSNCAFSSELQNLMRLIFSGISDIPSPAKNICIHCTQKCKIFLEFQRTVQESQEYLKSSISMIVLDEKLNQNRLENNTEGNEHNRGHLVNKIYRVLLNFLVK